MRPFATGSFALMYAALVASAALAQDTVTTQHNDIFRTGLQLDTHLTRAKVASQFGKLFTRILPDGPNASPGLRQRIYAQPLVDRLRNGKTIVIVATDFNMVYAFDAEDPAASAPLWSRDLGPQEISKNGDWLDDNCNKTLPAVGVLGTPDIERVLIPIPNRKLFTPDALYVVAKNRANKADITSHQVSFTIHKIDVATGAELASTPIAPKGFDPYLQVQRPGLVFVPSPSAPGGGYVYAAFSAHCDAGGAHGWVIGFDGNLSPSPVAAFNTSPDGQGAGIWQAGQAPAWFRSQKDGADYLFVNTGNGIQGTHPKLSESVLKLKVGATGDLTVADSFTPYNRDFLDSCDGDFASSGPTILRDKMHVISGGKQSVLYDLDISALGHGMAAGPGGGPSDCANGSYGIFQSNYNTATWNPNGDLVVDAIIAGDAHIHGAPVSAVGKDGKTRIYVWPEDGHLEAFTQLSTGKFDHNPVVNVSAPMTPMTAGADHHPMPGGTLSLSSLPGHQGEVIVWAAYPKSDAFNPPYNPGVQGILYAFDGADVTKKIWSSDAKPGDVLGEYSKFTPPTIANGRVYVATAEGKLQVYGLHWRIKIPTGPTPGPKPPGPRRLLRH